MMVSGLMESENDSALNALAGLCLLSPETEPIGIG